MLAPNINRIRISPHFLLSEFDCPHCHAVMIAPALVDALEQFREKVGRAVVITSGYRCPEHNRKIGGAPQSRHLFGDGVDIRLAGLGRPIEELAEIARSCGFTGIGLYDDHLHIDVRPGGPAFWDERKRGASDA